MTMEIEYGARNVRKSCYICELYRLRLLLKGTSDFAVKVRTG